MLLWGQSVPVALPPFPQKSAVICGKELVKGIARLLHMELFPVKGATGDVDAEKIDGVWEQRLRIHYNCVGTIDIPTVLALPIPEVSVNTRKGVVVNYAPCELAV